MTPDAIEQAIVAAHQQAFAAAPQPEPRPTPPCGPTSDASTAAAGRLRRLGFIAIDADCWPLLVRGTLRTSHFDARGLADAGNFDISGSAPAFAACPPRLGLYGAAHGRMGGPHERAGVRAGATLPEIRRPAAIRREVQAAVAAVRGTDALLFINDHWREAIAGNATASTWARKTWSRLQPRRAAAAARPRACAWGVTTLATPRWCAPAGPCPAILRWARSFHAQADGHRAWGLADALLGSPAAIRGGDRRHRRRAVRRSPAKRRGSIAVVRAIVNADNPEQAAQATVQRMAA